MSTRSHIADAENLMDSASNAPLVGPDPEAVKADRWLKMAQIRALLALAEAIEGLKEQTPQ